jgi:hypothetical protein
MVQVREDLVIGDGSGLASPVVPVKQGGAHLRDQPILPASHQKQRAATRLAAPRAPPVPRCTEQYMSRRARSPPSFLTRTLPGYRRRTGMSPPGPPNHGRRAAIRAATFRRPVETAG